MDGERSAPAHRWTTWFAGILFALFAVAIGIFLLIFPWLDSWNVNYFQESIPALRDVWDGPYVRSGIATAGLLNIYVACRQVIRLIRRS